MALHRRWCDNGSVESTNEGAESGPDLTVLVRDLGQPTVDLTKANRLAADLEDEEIVRAMAQGS